MSADTNTNFTHEELIDKIIEIELEMFRTVNSSVHSPCQDRLKTFKLMRWMTHSVMPMHILESYYKDCSDAAEAGWNFMVEKYARMENRIEPLKECAAINTIVDAEMQWMEEVSVKYPNTFEKKGDAFRNYLSCELETLSTNTLELVEQEIKSALSASRNLVEERYNNLFKRLGYESLADRDSKASEETPS